MDVCVKKFYIDSAYKLNPLYILIHIITGGKLEISSFLNEREHKNKGVEYISKHSKNFIVGVSKFNNSLSLFQESYDTAMSQKYREDSSTYLNVDPEVWIEVVGF